jgi:dihydroorotase
MKHGLALINGKVFYKGSLQDRNIYIENGKITQVRNSELAAERKLDCRGKIIIPGMIDAHVHMREPGLTHKEDFLSGSMAAAHGGVTTFIDMPNTKPPTLTIEELEAKRELAAKSTVNYGFHFGSSADNLGEIVKAQERNIASVKVFMNVSTGRMLIEDDDTLSAIFENSRLVTAHAEGEKVRKALAVWKGRKTKLYLCHISSREEIDMVKKEAVMPYVEVAPHHLFLTSKDVDSPLKEVHPAIKSAADQQALWSSIRAGVVTTIGSDHAPHTAEEKEAENPPRGMPGLETTLPLVMDAVNRGKITLAKAVQLCCENPAKVFGIRERGFIEKGYAADLVVIDLRKEHKISNSELFTKCGWSPYDGFRLKGAIAATIVNGNVVYDGSDVIREHKGEEVSFNVGQGRNLQGAF